MPLSLTLHAADVDTGSTIAAAMILLMLTTLLNCTHSQEVVAHVLLQLAQTKCNLKDKSCRSSYIQDRTFSLLLLSSVGEVGMYTGSICQIVSSQGGTFASSDGGCWSSALQPSTGYF